MQRYKKRKHNSKFRSKSKPSNGNKRGTKRYWGGRSNNNSKGNKNYWRNRRNKIKIDVERYINIPNASAEVQTQDTIYDTNITFDTFSLHSDLKINISKQGYKHPTNIQSTVIPHVINGKDILAQAATGSGKTAAFLIPLINKCIEDPSQKVLIITPTRELATQINNEFKKLTYGINLKMVLIIGGSSMKGQILFLAKNPNFMVATPGRLIDLENRNKIKLAKFNTVVLDEVDQMLDMGFFSDIELITGKLAHKKQTVFVSATLNKKEELIANKMLVNPIKVSLNKRSTLERIKQDVIKVKSYNHKIEILTELLTQKAFEKVLVFSGTKRNADTLATVLQKTGLKTDSLHGDKSQHKRSRILAKFKDNKIDILIATDVASRGIDIDDISHVINFDEPQTYNDYVHRIGRTGRIGKQGEAITFVLEKRKRF